MRTIGISPDTKTYTQVIKSIFGSSLIGYWPLNEAAGTVAIDASGNGRHGTYTSVTLGQTGIGDGNTSPSFNGTSSKVNLSSASLIAAYNGAESTQIIWVKVSAAADWTDGVARGLFQLADTGFTRQNCLVKNAAENTLAPTSMGRTPATMGGSTDWYQIAMTRSESNNRVRTYFNGSLQQSGAIVNNWGVLALGQAWLGDIGIGFFHKGNLAHAMLLNREATADEIYNSFRLGTPPATRFSILGDSISTYEYSYAWRVPAKYNGGGNYLANRAVTGQTILSHMDAQTLAAASDNANIIIIALGTNDDNAGNMATLQSKGEENILRLKVSNPSAEIYWLNVLPRWTNNTGAVVVDKANIRTAIAAACAAQNITCLNLSITAAQTIDGTHLNASGFSSLTDDIISAI